MNVFVSLMRAVKELYPIEPWTRRLESLSRLYSSCFAIPSPSISLDPSSCWIKNTVPINQGVPSRVFHLQDDDVHQIHVPSKTFT